MDSIVFSGGGIKGLNYIGVLKKFEELDLIKNIKNMAGSSIGAFFCVLINIGYTSKELEQFVSLFNLDKIRKTKISNFFSYLGIDKGKCLTIVLENMFVEKGFDKKITLKELYDKTHIKLTITASCLNEQKCYYLDYVDYPDLNVIKAIRMSVSIPFYFTPVIYKDKLFVDGGVMDNYPIHLFDKKNVKGFYLFETPEIINNINNIETYLYSLFSCVKLGIYEKLLIGYKEQTTVIKSNSISMLDTNLSKKKIKEFIDNGYNSFI